MSSTPPAAPEPLPESRLTRICAPGEASSNTARLLRERLRTVSLLILIALLAWSVRTAFVDMPSHAIFQVAALASLAALAALLWSRAALSEWQLRALEGLLVGLTALRLVGVDILLLRDRLLADRPLLALGQLHNTVFAVAALVVLYGMLVPNHWRRAFVVATLVAMAPPAAWFALRWLDPASAAIVSGMVGLEVGSTLVMTLAVGVLVATAGSHVIYSLDRHAAAISELGPYTLERRLASGGMGEIWQARHRLLARPAAIKVIHPERIDPLDRVAAGVILRRFEQEARATAMLESRHTVQVYDFGRTEAGDFYYAMELLKGLDLESLVTRYGPVPPSRAVHFLVQACDSLAEAHAKGQVHRDIKPSNLFVCNFGREYDVVKVLDFGLVTRAGSEQGRDLRLEEGDGMAGTPAYMAPEQVLAVTQIDERSDLYSLGCVAYWLLTGHTLFDIERPLAMAVAHVKAPPMPPSRRTELPIPRDLERLVMKCLAKAPADRPASAETLADRLIACKLQCSWDQAEARAWWERHRPLEQSASVAIGGGTRTTN